jgi:hypothetical protein
MVPKSVTYFGYVEATYFVEKSRRSLSCRPINRAPPGRYGATVGRHALSFSSHVRIHNPSSEMFEENEIVFGVYSLATYDTVTVT